MSASGIRRCHDYPDTSKSTAPCNCGKVGCRVDISIENKGTINIYNCTGGAQLADEKRPPPLGLCTGAVAPGQCVPLSIGSKPKQSLRSKLDSLLTNTNVPSAIASGFFQHGRRFAAGKMAANPLEAEVFSFFHTLPADMKSILSCSVGSFDGIKKDERERLFDPSISQDPDVPLDGDTLAAALLKELTQRVGTQVFGDPQALEAERPGRNRFYDIPPGAENFDVQL